MALRHDSMVEVNEFLVLDFVRERGATTRPEIGEALGLSPASVSRIVRRLLEQDVVHEVSSVGEPNVGRPRTTITFNNRAGAVIGVDLGGTKCHGVLADLGGAIVEETVLPTSAEGGPYPTLAAVVQSLEAAAASLGLPVEAMAVGVPAIVDPLSGVAIGGPNVQWHGFPIVRELEALTPVPLVVENDVNLAALAHAWRGDARGHADFVTLAIGTGIGSAIVADRRLIKGRTNAAGEVGYLVLSREQLGEPPVGGPGGFERVASGPAILARARDRMRQAGRSERELESLTAEGVFAAAMRGDQPAREVIEDVLDHVALGLIALIAVADPEVVILEGSVGRALEPYVAQLLERVGPQVPSSPRLVISTLGSDATAIGAVAAALQLMRHRRSPRPWRDARINSGTVAANAMLDLPALASLREA